MIRVVKRRADEVVHRRVHDEEIFFARAFDVFDTCDEDARVAGDETSGFEQDFHAERLEQRHEARGIFCGVKMFFAAADLHQAAVPLASAGS